MTTAPAAADLPAWLPDYALLYLRHVEQGISIRELARREGLHASTVLRRVRRIESRRDDPLVDEALARLGDVVPARPLLTGQRKEDPEMTAPIRTKTPPLDEVTLAREGRRILRRLAEAGSLMIVAPDMDKAVVLRGTVRIAVLERAVAQAFALQDWIAVKHQGRVTSYEISAAGRAALKRMIDEDRAACGADPAAEEDPANPHADQHRDWGTREFGEEDGRPRRLRANLAESPLGVLARRRDVNGEPFLAPDLVAAGERLREDFELAQMGPRVAQNWERFLTGGDRGQYRPDLSTGSGGSERARERVAAALRDLGPGLGDMVLRCCCFLEGLETAERRLGWSARSGKIVLRIALMRLKRHYDEAYGGQSPLIG
ncbi:MAG: helix-turn-helix domain-containing protein [Sphingomonadales bacterium]|nr:helix-turn-helix domain-containing protein [Sphingomonadales bacterium]